MLPDGWNPQAPYLGKILEEEYGRLWIVHRLDRETSGVLLMARTAPAHRELNSQFEKRLVEKIYHALVIGIPGWSEKTVNLPLRANVGHKHRTMVDHTNGKEARTDINVLDRFPSGYRIDNKSSKTSAPISLIQAIPHTGRTHQIRVHLTACGYPILGDRLYFLTSALQITGLTRLALHARSISFHHPSSNQKLTFEVDYPGDLEWLISQLQQ